MRLNDGYETTPNDAHCIDLDRRIPRTACTTSLNMTTKEASRSGIMTLPLQEKEEQYKHRNHTFILYTQADRMKQSKMESFGVVKDMQRSFTSRIPTMDGRRTATPGRLGARLPFVVTIKDHKRSSSPNATFQQNTLSLGSSLVVSKTARQLGIHQHGKVRRDHRHHQSTYKGNTGRRCHCEGPLVTQHSQIKSSGHILDHGV